MDFMSRIYKPGQIVTIDGNKYRAVKQKEGESNNEICGSVCPLKGKCNHIDCVKYDIYFKSIPKSNFEHFRSFMIANKAWKKFKSNYSLKTVSFDEYWKHENVYSYVLAAFEWVLTHQGHDYWSSLSEAWKDYVTAHKLT